MVFRPHLVPRAHFQFYIRIFADRSRYVTQISKVEEDGTKYVIKLGDERCVKLSIGNVRTSEPGTGEERNDEIAPSWRIF